MRLLVLAENYSSPDGLVAQHFIHSRNKWYVKKGIDVSVISFRAQRDYDLDGVKVYTYETYEKRLKGLRFDILLSHAPNLKNHYRFLKMHSKRFNNIIFFFHGHEVLRVSQIYPQPYDFCKKKQFQISITREIYDTLKLGIWGRYFKELAYKSHFVFVSNWMYDMFTRYVKLDPRIIEGRKHIIYNCIGEYFEHVDYELCYKAKYDFITIRNSLDGAKYGIDIVTKLAENHPYYRFCVVGKGKFYNYNVKPSNLTWLNKHLCHDEAIDLLNDSRCALMPTRADAQGVMACEMATFGIPLITSDIDVCKEVFAGFEKVEYINNDKLDIDLERMLGKLAATKTKGKNTKYFAENTIGKEIALFEHIKGEIR